MDSLSETRAFSSHLLEPNTTKTRMDVESLQTSARPRVRCLDVFLVMSVVFLFVVVAAVTAAGVMVATELRTETHVRPSLLTHDGTGTQVGDDPGYKMQNFAYVQAIQSVLSNSTMEWAPVSYLTVDSVGTKFSFDRTLQVLQTKQKDGSYFMYLDLNLTCTSICSAGLLTVRLEDQHRKAQLTCTVELPAGAVSTPVSKKCWTVKRLSGDSGETQLVAQMTVTVPEKELKNWKLELNSSGLGMFLVA